MKNRFFIILAFLIVGCSGPQIIDQQDMEVIIRDALLTQAIEQCDMSLRRDKSMDSVDYYTPILERMGYSMADFNYTVGHMASRKSNPLNAILDRVVLQIDQMALNADGKYRNFVRSDSIVVAMFSDTVYFKKDTIFGRFKKRVISLKDVRDGTYTVELDYSSIADYRAGGKSITYAAGDSTKWGEKSVVVGNLWLQRKLEPTHFQNSFIVNRRCDTLNFRFKDPVVGKGVKYVDSSYVTNMRIVYSPSIEKARIKFMQKIHGNDKYLFRYEKPQDSLALRFWPKR